MENKNPIVSTFCETCRNAFCICDKNKENKPLPQSLIDYLNKKYPINEETGINDKHTLLMFRGMVMAGYNLCLSEKQTQIEQLLYKCFEAGRSYQMGEYSEYHGGNEHNKPNATKWIAENLPTFLVQSPKESE